MWHGCPRKPAADPVDEDPEVALEVEKEKVVPDRDDSETAAGASVDEEAEVDGSAASCAGVAARVKTSPSQTEFQTSI